MFDHPLNGTTSYLEVLEAALTDAVVVVMDAELNVAGWSSAAENLLGWSAEEAIGRPGTEIAPPVDVRERAEHELAIRTHGWSGISRVYNRCGDPLVIESTVIPRRTPDGVAYLSIMRNWRNLRKPSLTRSEQLTQPAQLYAPESDGWLSPVSIVANPDITAVHQRRGKNLRLARRLAGNMSQERFGELLANELGLEKPITAARISRWENPTHRHGRAMGLRHRIAASRVLNVPLTFFDEEHSWARETEA